MSTRDWQGVRHDWGCECEKLTAELNAVREELRNANRGAEKNMHMTQLALKEKHAAEADRDRLKNLLEMSELTRKADRQLADRYKAALEEIVKAADEHTNWPEPCSCHYVLPEDAKAALTEEKRK